MLATWWLRLKACRALRLQTSVLFVKQGGEGDRAGLLFPEASEQKATSFSAGCPECCGPLLRVHLRACVPIDFFVNMLWYANAGTAEGAFVILKQRRLRKILRLCRALPLFGSSGLQVYLLLLTAESLCLQGLVRCYLAPFRISYVQREVGICRMSARQCLVCSSDELFSLSCYHTAFLLWLLM